MDVLNTIKKTISMVVVVCFTTTSVLISAPTNSYAVVQKTIDEDSKVHIEELARQVEELEDGKEYPTVHMHHKLEELGRVQYATTQADKILAITGKSLGEEEGKWSLDELKRGKEIKKNMIFKTIERMEDAADKGDIERWLKLADFALYPLTNSQTDPDFPKNLRKFKSAFKKTRKSFRNMSEDEKQLCDVIAERLQILESTTDTESTGKSLGEEETDSYSKIPDNSADIMKMDSREISNLGLDDLITFQKGFTDKQKQIIRENTIKTFLFFAGEDRRNPEAVKKILHRFHVKKHSIHFGLTRLAFVISGLFVGHILFKIIFNTTRILLDPKIDMQPLHYLRLGFVLGLAVFLIYIEKSIDGIKKATGIFNPRFKNTIQVKVKEILVLPGVTIHEIAHALMFRSGSLFWNDLPEAVAQILTNRKFYRFNIENTNANYAGYELVHKYLAETIDTEEFLSSIYKSAGSIIEKEKRGYFIFGILEGFQEILGIEAMDKVLLAMAQTKSKKDKHLSSVLEDLRSDFYAQITKSGSMSDKTPDSSDQPPATGINGASLGEEREELIEKFAAITPIADKKDFAQITVSITDYCPIGCNFCAFSSRPKRGPPDPAMTLSDDGIEKFNNFVNSSGAKSVCITGGGEPTIEPKKLSTLVSKVKVKSLNLVTAGHWASTPEKTEKFLEKLDKSLQENKDNGNTEIKFLLAVSVPAPKYRKVPLKNLINIINALRNKEKYPNIDALMVRSPGGVWKNYLHDEILAQFPGKIVDAHGFFSGNILLDDGFKILYHGIDVDYSGDAINLEEAKIYLANRRKKRISDFIKPDDKRTTFGNLMGDDVLRMGLYRKDLGTYEVQVSSSGAIGFNMHINRDFQVADIYKHNFEDFEKRWYTEPITMALRDPEKGVEHIIGIATKINPKLKKEAVDTGWPDHALAICLKDPLMKLMVTKWLILEAYRERAFSISVLQDMGLTKNRWGFSLPKSYKDLIKEYKVRKRRSDTDISGKSLGAEKTGISQEVIERLIEKKLLPVDRKGKISPDDIKLLKGVADEWPHDFARASSVREYLERTPATFNRRIELLGIKYEGSRFKGWLMKKDDVHYLLLREKLFKKYILTRTEADLLAGPSAGLQWLINVGRVERFDDEIGGGYFRSSLEELLKTKEAGLKGLIPEGWLTRAEILEKVREEFPETKNKQMEYVLGELPDNIKTQVINPYTKQPWNAYHPSAIEMSLTTLRKRTSEIDLDTIVDDYDYKLSALSKATGIPQFRLLWQGEKGYINTSGGGKKGIDVTVKGSEARRLLLIEKERSNFLDQGELYTVTKVRKILGFSIYDLGREQIRPGYSVVQFGSKSIPVFEDHLNRVRVPESSVKIFEKEIEGASLGGVEYPGDKEFKKLLKKHKAHRRLIAEELNTYVLTVRKWIREHGFEKLVEKLEKERGESDPDISLGKTAQNAIYIDGTIRNGKRVGGKFIGAVPDGIQENHLKDIPHMIVENIKFGNRGIFKVAKKAVWYEKTGYENAKGNTAVIENGKVTEVYDKKGNKIYSASDVVHRGDVYVGAKIKKGKRVGGKLVGSLPRSVRDFYLKKYPDIIVENVSFNSNGGFVLKGSDAPTRRRGYENAKGNTLVIEKGELIAIYDKDGKKIYDAGPTGEAAAYVDAKIQKGKRVGGKFIRTFPKNTRKSEIDKFPNMILENVTLDARGGYIFGGTWVVTQRSGYENAEGNTVVFKEGKAVAVYDKDGKPIALESDTLQRAVYESAEIKDGKRVGGELLGKLPQSQIKQYLARHPDIVIENVKFNSNGGLAIAGNLIWERKTGYEYAEGNTVVFKEGQIIEVYDREGEQIYLGGKDARNAVYVDAIIRKGRRAGGRFVTNVPHRQEVNYFEKNPNVIVENVVFDLKGGFRVGKQRLWASKEGYEYAEGNTIVVKGGVITAVYDKNGKYLGGETGRNAVYIGAKIIDGKRTGGKFVQNFPAYITEDHLNWENPNCIIENVQFNNNGGFRIGGKKLWHSRRGYENAKGNTVVIKDGDAVEVYNAKGELIYSKSKEVHKGDVYVGAKILKGKRVGGKLIAAPKTISKQFLKENPDVIIENLKLDHVGGLMIGAEKVWNVKKGYEYAEGVTAVVTNGEMTEAFDQDGVQIYAKSEIINRDIYIDSEIRGGRRVGGTFIGTLGASGFVKVHRRAYETPIHEVSTEAEEEIDEAEQMLEVPDKAVTITKKTKKSEEETTNHIIKWFRSGKGLKKGEYIVRKIRFGSQKDFRKGDKFARFYFKGYSDRKGEEIDAVFLAEEDINHGLVLNVYSLKDYNSGDILTPIYTYKYVPELQKVKNVNLAALDIIAMAYSKNEPRPVKRPPIKRKVGKSGFLPIYGLDLPNERQVINFAVPAQEKMKLLGKEIFIEMDIDEHYGRVLHFYLASDYEAGKKDAPLRTYKVYEGLDHKTGRPREYVPINMGVLDVLNAYKGEGVSVLGRPAEAVVNQTVRDKRHGVGVCRISFLSPGTPGFQRTEFVVPKEQMDKGALGKRVVVKVEKDINQGQVINLYLKEDLKKSQDSAPIATYKYFSATGKPGRCRIIEPTKMDMADYVSGRADIKPVKNRVYDATIYYDSNAGRYYTDFMVMARKVMLSIPPEKAKGIFSKKRIAGQAQLTIKEDPDYGPYIDISHDGKTLAKFYYHQGLRYSFQYVDFSRLALMDYIFGNKNVHGEPILPRSYTHTGKVTVNGNAVLFYAGHRLAPIKLMPLIGKQPIFIPVPDKKHGYLIHVHDAAAYKRNKKRKPDVILVRNDFFKRLIPLDEAHKFKKMESTEKGELLHAAAMINPLVQGGKATIRLKGFLGVYPDIVIDNVKLNAHGGLRLGGVPIWQAKKGYEHAEGNAVVIERGEVTAVYDKDGKLIYKGEQPILDARFNDLVETGDIHKLLENFGVGGAYRILLRIHQFSPWSLKELLSSYGKMKGSKQLEDILRKKRRFSFIDVRQLEFPEPAPSNISDILAEEIITGIYSHVVEDSEYLKDVLAESKNKANSPYLRKSYKKAYDYYRKIGKKKLKWINETAILLKFYQRMGIDFLMHIKRAILADEPRLGKTIQAILAALNIRNGKGARKVLIVCPKSARNLWKEEVEGKTTGRQKVAVITKGGTQNAKKNREIKNARFVVVNYDLLIGEKNKLRDRLKRMGFDFIIVDEAHRMRNESLQTEALRELDAEYKVLVTATPLVGRKISKLFNLVNWLYPELFPDKKKFMKEYGDGEQGLLKLREDIRKFTLRRTKRDILGIAPNNFINIPVVLSPKQRAIYQEIEEDFRGWMENQTGEKMPPMLTVLAKLIKLRQAAINPALVGESTRGPPAKYKALDQLVEEKIKSGEKLVIYSEYVQVIHDLVDRYQAKGIPVNYLVGREMSVKQREAEIEEFRSRDEAGLFISTKAGWEAISLASKTEIPSGNVVFVDKPWTSEERDQAADRPFDVEKQEPIDVYSLIAQNTIDEHIENILFAGDIIAQLLLGQDPSATQLSGELIETVLKRLSYPDDVVKEMVNYREQIKTKDKDVERPERFTELQDDEGYWVQFKKRNFSAILKTKDGKDTEIDNFTDLMKASNNLSGSSRRLVQNFFKNRLEYELDEKLPIKKSFIWYLAKAFVPQMKNIDYYPEIEANLEIFRLLLDLTLHDKELTMDTLKGVVRNNEALDRALYFLDVNNIFMVLSAIGVLNKEYYYDGELLKYRAPLETISFEGDVSYVDKAIVETIAPNRRTLPSDPTIGFSYDIEAESYRKLTRAEEIRLAREAWKGNQAAKEALFECNLTSLVAGTKRILQSIRARLGDEAADHIDIDDLYSVGSEELYLSTQEYFPEADHMTYAKYVYPYLMKRISREAYKIASISMKERDVLDSELIPKEVLDRQMEESQLLKDSGIIKLAQEILREKKLTDDEIDVFLSLATGQTVEEIAKTYSISKRKAEDIIETAQNILKNSESFMVRAADITGKSLGEEKLFNFEKLPGVGRATMFYHFMNALLPVNNDVDEDINIMLTYKCPFHCAHCLARDAIKEDAAKDADKELLKSIFDELEGFRLIHLVGTGETTAYGKDKLLKGGVSEDFLEVVRYAAERIDEVRIVTNGYLVPEDLEEARKFFAQFPDNVAWVVSVDDWHEKEMKKRLGKSLTQIIDIMEKLVSEDEIKVAYNIRVAGHEEIELDDMKPMLERLGLAHRMVQRYETVVRVNNIFINSVMEQGSAKENIPDTKEVRDEDIQEHSEQPTNLFPFITPQGDFVTSDHVAYMASRQHRGYYPADGKNSPFIGNVNENSLADLMLKLLFDYYELYIYSPIAPAGSINNVELEDDEIGILKDVVTSNIDRQKEIFEETIVNEDFKAAILYTIARFNRERIKRGDQYDDWNKWFYDTLSDYPNVFNRLIYIDRGKGIWRDENMIHDFENKPAWAISLFNAAKKMKGSDIFFTYLNTFLDLSIAKKGLSVKEVSVEDFAGSIRNPLFFNIVLNELLSETDTGTLLARWTGWWHHFNRWQSANYYYVFLSKYIEELLRQGPNGETVAKEFRILTSEAEEYHKGDYYWASEEGIQDSWNWAERLRDFLIVHRDRIEAGMPATDISGASLGDEVVPTNYFKKADEIAPRTAVDQLTDKVDEVLKWMEEGLFVKRADKEKLQALKKKLTSLEAEEWRLLEALKNEDSVDHYGKLLMVRRDACSVFSDNGDLLLRVFQEGSVRKTPDGKTYLLSQSDIDEMGHERELEMGLVDIGLMEMKLNTALAAIESSKTEKVPLLDEKLDPIDVYSIQHKPFDGEINFDNLIDVTDEKLSQEEQRKRTNSLKEELLGVTSTVDTGELDITLGEISQKYMELARRFETESEKRESPFSTGLIYYDYHHPVSGWILESSMINQGIYSFRLAKQTDVGQQALISLEIHTKGDTTPVIAYFAPGADIELREETDAGIFMSTSAIPGRTRIRIVDPALDDFREFAEGEIAKYIKKENEIARRIALNEFLIEHINEMLKDPHHPRRGDSSDESLREQLNFLEEQINDVTEELKIAKLPLRAIKIMARERVVAEVVLPEDKAHPFAGVLSYSQLGVSSPLDLLRRIDEIYPSIEQLLLTGRAPEGFANTPLFLDWKPRIEGKSLGKSADQYRDDMKGTSDFAHRLESARGGKKVRAREIIYAEVGNPSRLKRPLKVLDLGTGSGRFPMRIKAQLEKMGYQVEITAVEESADMIKKALANNPDKEKQGIRIVESRILSDGRIESDVAVVKENDFDLIFMNAPTISLDGVYSHWFNAFKRYVRKGDEIGKKGIGIIRLHSHLNMPFGQGRTTRRLESDALKQTFKLDAQMVYQEFAYDTSPDFVSGDAPLGPAILLSTEKSGFNQIFVPLEQFSGKSLGDEAFDARLQVPDASFQEKIDTGIRQPVPGAQITGASLGKGIQSASKEMTVEYERGIHSRPSTTIALLSELIEILFKTSLVFKHRIDGVDEEASGTVVRDLMALEIDDGAVVTVNATGPQDQETLEMILDVMEKVLKDPTALEWGVWDRHRNELIELKRETEGKSLGEGVYIEKGHPKFREKLQKRIEAAMNRGHSTYLKANSGSFKSTTFKVLMNRVNKTDSDRKIMLTYAGGDWKEHDDPKVGYDYNLLRKSIAKEEDELGGEVTDIVIDGLRVLRDRYQRKNLLELVSYFLTKGYNLHFIDVVWYGPDMWRDLEKLYKETGNTLEFITAPSINKKDTSIIKKIAFGKNKRKNEILDHYLEIADGWVNPAHTLYHIFHLPISNTEEIKVFEKEAKSSNSIEESVLYMYASWHTAIGNHFNWVNYKSDGSLISSLLRRLVNDEIPNIVLTEVEKNDYTSGKRSLLKTLQDRYAETDPMVVEAFYKGLLWFDEEASRIYLPKGLALSLSLVFKRLYFDENIDNPLKLSEMEAVIRKVLPGIEKVDWDRIKKLIDMKRTRDFYIDPDELWLNDSYEKASIGELEHRLDSLSRFDPDKVDTYINDWNSRDTIAIADIHGEIDKLEKLLAYSPSGSWWGEGPRKTIVLLGDYINHYPGSIKVIEKVMDLVDEKAVALMGNHELAFIQSMLGDKDAFWYVWFSTFASSAHGTWMSIFREIGFSEEELKNIDRLNRKDKADRTASEQEALDNFHKSVIENPKLKELARWMIENLKLFHVDKYGILYMHSGIPFDMNNKPLFTSLGELSQLEHNLRNVTSYQDPVFEKLKSFLFPVNVLGAGFGQTREPEFISDFLEKLGVNKLVIGHIEKDHFTNIDNKLFMIDTNLMGYFEAGINGVRFYGFTDKTYYYIQEIDEESSISEHDFIDWFQDELVKAVERQTKRAEEALSKLNDLPSADISGKSLGDEARRARLQVPDASIQEKIDTGIRQLVPGTQITGASLGAEDLEKRLIAQALSKQREMLSDVPVVEQLRYVLPGTVLRDDLWEIEGKSLINSLWKAKNFPEIDDTKRIAQEPWGQKLSLEDPRFQEKLQQLIERPAQLTVIKILELGGVTQLAHAWGVGMKGVQWEKDGTRYFTPLTESDYKQPDMRKDVFFVPDVAKPVNLGRAVRHDITNLMATAKSYLFHLEMSGIRRSEKYLEAQRQLQEKLQRLADSIKDEDLDDDMWEKSFKKAFESYRKTVDERLVNNLLDELNEEERKELNNILDAITFFYNAFVGDDPVKEVNLRRIFEVIEHTELGEPYSEFCVFKANYQPDSEFVTSQESALYRVLLNIVRNAKEAMMRARDVLYESGDKDGFKNYKEDIIVDVAKSPAGAVILRISDTGPGMPAKAIEAFETGEVYSSKGYLGGRGLRTIKAISEQLNIDVSIDSEIGKGTTFTVRIPIKGASLGYANVKAEGLIEGNDLWQDPRVVEVMKDLEKNGLKNFKEIPRKDIPSRLHAGRGIQIEGVFQHKNGLQIIKKQIGEFALPDAERIKGFFESKVKWITPTFFIAGDDVNSYEINLMPLGYQSLRDINAGNGNLYEPVRANIRLAASETFRQGKRLFNHGHLHGGNILIKTDDNGILEDLKFIDWKQLHRAQLPEEFMDFIQGNRNDLIDVKLPQYGSRLELSGFDFSDVDARGMNLSHMTASWANFKDTNLEGANFYSANLMGVDFRGANLRGADFSHADIRGANFSGADLTNANLSTVSNAYANFDGAIFKDTIVSFTGLDYFKDRGFHITQMPNGTDYMVTSPTPSERKDFDARTAALKSFTIQKVYNDLEKVEDQPVAFKWNERMGFRSDDPMKKDIFAEIETLLLEKRIKLIVITPHASDIDWFPASYEQMSERVVVIKELTKEALDIHKGFIGKRKVVYLNDYLNNSKELEGKMTDKQRDNIMVVQPRNRVGIVTAAILFASGNKRYKGAFEMTKSGIWAPTAIGASLGKIAEELLSQRILARAA